MNIKQTLEYKLRGERNNRPRKPIVLGDKLFVIFVYDKKGSTESRIQCLNIDNFNLIWEYTLGHVINNIILLENRTLLTSCMNGRIICLNALNGETIWEYVTTESNIGAISNEVNCRVVFSGIQRRGKKTYCIDTNKGTLLWEVENAGHSYVPIINAENVFNTIGNNLYCLDMNTGSTLWKSSEPRTYLFNPKIFQHLVLASGHGILNAYELGTGQIVCSIEVPVSKFDSASAIREVVSDAENIYFGDALGNFYCYGMSEKAFTLKWKVETRGPIESVPLLLDQHVLIINNALQLISINKKDGVVEFEKKTKGEANISGLTIDNGIIYFSCGGGVVCKYEKE
jgi:outer membrane protein assembly factor BamB